MRDYKKNISSTNANSIAQWFNDNGYKVELHEGVLVNNYLIEVMENNIKLGKAKCRNYIIIREVCLNEWCSGTELIMTDNENLFKEYKKMYELAA